MRFGRGTFVLQLLATLVGVTVLSTALYGARAEEAASPSLVIMRAKEVIRDRAFDPGAVTFKDVFTHKPPGKVMVACGLYNGKNRYGGYTGVKHFVAGGLPNLTFTEDDVRDFRKVWNGLCMG